jgi:hypothetical protein
VRRGWRRAKLLIGGSDSGAGFGRLEAEVGEGGQRIRGAASARAAAPILSGQRRAAELAGQLVDDPLGKLGPTPLARATIALSPR